MLKEAKKTQASPAHSSRRGASVAGNDALNRNLGELVVLAMPEFRIIPVRGAERSSAIHIRLHGRHVAVACDRIQREGVLQVLNKLRV